MKYYKYLLSFCFFGIVLNIGSAQALPPLEITPDTSIQFKEKTNILVYVDKNNKDEYDDVLKKIDQFMWTPMTRVFPWASNILSFFLSELKTLFVNIHRHGRIVWKTVGNTFNLILLKLYVTTKLNNNNIVNYFG